MPFTLTDLMDLKRLLLEHPEWRAELRELVLTEELLTLPRMLAEAQARSEARFERIEHVLQELAQAQARVEERLTRLEQVVARLEQVVEGLVQVQARTEERLTRLEQVVEGLVQAQARAEERLTRLEQVVEELAQAQARTEARLDNLIKELRETNRTVQGILDRQGQMLGTLLESKYADHAVAYFGEFLRRIRVQLPFSLDDAVEDLLESRLTREEVREVHRLDVLLVGRLREPRNSDHETWLAVEVSGIVDRNDVERAERRAALLRKAGLCVVPFVAGEAITQGAKDLLEEMPVALMLDGRSEGWDKALHYALSQSAAGD